MNLKVFSLFVLIAAMFTFAYGSATLHVTGDQDAKVNVFSPKNSLTSESKLSAELNKESNANVYNLRGKKRGEDLNNDSSSKGGMNINIDTRNAGTLTTNAESTITCVNQDNQA